MVLCVNANHFSFLQFVRTDFYSPKVHSDAPQTASVHDTYEYNIVDNHASDQERIMQKFCMKGTRR